MSHENQKELTRILAEPSRHLECQKAPHGPRKREIIPEAQSIGLDTAIRRPLPVLGGTLEKFAVSSEYLDDQRAEAVKSAYIVGESTLMSENASRFRNIAGQSYDSETLTEELLEAVRPKYDLLIPHSLLNAQARSGISDENDAMEEGYRVMHKAAANLQCEFREYESNQPLNIEGEVPEDIPEVAFLDSVAHMEKRLRIPEFAKMSVMHPETAMRAAEESVNMTAAAKDYQRTAVDIRQLKDSDVNDLGSFFVGSDRRQVEIPKTLLDQLNLITPRSTHKIDPNAAITDEDRIHDKLQSAGELVQQSMKNMLNHPDAMSALSDIDPRLGDGSMVKNAHGVYKLSEHSDTFTQSGILQPLPANENPLFLYPLVPSESWDFCHLVNEVNPCGELKLRHAPEVVSLLSEKSINALLNDLDKARHAYYMEIREEKERILAAKLAETHQQELEFEAELLTRRKLDARAKAQAKKATMDMNKSLLSVRDIMRPLDEATALLDQSDIATFGEAGLLELDLEPFEKISPAALKRRQAAEKLADDRNMHYNTFSNWHSKRVLPVLKYEGEVTAGSCPMRPLLRHLEQIYELEVELKPTLAWSETDEADLSDRLRRETKPNFDDITVIKRLVKEDKEVALRLKMREILKNLIRRPRTHNKASTRISRINLDNIFCTKILYQGIVWQPTFVAHKGFLWAVCYETGLVLYQIPSSTVIQLSLSLPSISVKEIDGSIIAVLPFGEGKLAVRENAELASTFESMMFDKSLLRRKPERVEKFSIRFSPLFAFTSTDISTHRRGLVNFRFVSAPDEPIFTAWLLALNNGMAYSHHCARLGSPWPHVQSCLTSIDMSTLDLSFYTLNVAETAELLKDLDLRATTKDNHDPLKHSAVGIRSIEIRGANLSVDDILKLASLIPNSSINGWFLANNPKLGEGRPLDLISNGILKLTDNLKELDLSECELRDTIELGQEIAKLIYNRRHLALVNLQNNTLGTKFVYGMTSFFKDRLDELKNVDPKLQDSPVPEVHRRQTLGREDDPQATNLLLSNNALNNASAAELIEVIKQLQIFAYVNLNGCALIQHGFLAKLMENNPTLLLKADERTSASSGSSLMEVCQVASKSNTLRLYLLPWQRSLTGPLHIEEVRFPSGLLSSLIHKVAQLRGCFTARLRQCAGDMFMASDLAAAFSTPVLKIRALDLSYSEWYSPETQKSAEEYYVGQGSMSIDGRLLNILEVTQAFNIRELKLRHTAAFDGSVFNSKHVAEFLFKLITQSDLEVLDLTGCDLGNEEFRVLCQLLAAKRTSDEVRDAFYLDEHKTNLVVETWHRSTIFGKKNLRILAKCNVTTGGLKRQWAIRSISLDHCTRLEEQSIQNFVKLLLKKAPLLYILSLAEVINKSWASVESWKFAGFDPRSIQGASTEGLPLTAEGDRIMVPAPDQNYDDLLKSGNHLLLSRLYVDARDKLRHLQISDEEALREKARVIKNWIQKLEESKDHQRTARRRLRKRQLHKFVGRCQRRGAKGSRLSTRMPNTIENLRAERGSRITRRMERVGCTELNDGIFPPYRLPPNLFVEIHSSKNGLYRPYTEIDRFLTQSTERILDLSCCYYDSYVMEDVIAKILATEGEGHSSHIECLNIVNCGFDSGHAIDLAQIVGAYDFRCDKIDFSVNQLDADRSLYREALGTLIINMQVKCLILDCNLFLDSKNLADVLLLAITRGLCEVMSLRHNGLGKVFIKHFIRRCDELLLESINSARNTKAQKAVPLDPPTSKSNLAVDLGGIENQILIGGKIPGKSREAKDSMQVKRELDRVGLHGSAMKKGGNPSAKVELKLSKKNQLQSASKVVSPSNSPTKTLAKLTMKPKLGVKTLVKSSLSSKPKEGESQELTDETKDAQQAADMKRGDRVEVGRGDPKRIADGHSDTGLASSKSSDDSSRSSSSSRSLSSSSSSSTSNKSGIERRVEGSSSSPASGSSADLDSGRVSQPSRAAIEKAGSALPNKRADIHEDPQMLEYERIKPQPRPDTCLKNLAAPGRQQNEVYTIPSPTEVRTKMTTKFVRKYLANRASLKPTLKILDLRSNPDLPADDILLLTTKLKLICPNLEEVRVDPLEVNTHLTSEYLAAQNGALKHPEHVGVFPEDLDLIKDGPKEIDEADAMFEFSKSYMRSKSSIMIPDRIDPKFVSAASKENLKTSNIPKAYSGQRGIAEGPSTPLPHVLHAPKNPPSTKNAKRAVQANTKNPNPIKLAETSELIQNALRLNANISPASPDALQISKNAQSLLTNSDTAIPAREVQDEMNKNAPKASTRLSPSNRPDETTPKAKASKNSAKVPASPHIDKRLASAKSKPPFNKKSKAGKSPKPSKKALPSQEAMIGEPLASPQGSLNGATSKDSPARMRGRSLGPQEVSTPVEKRGIVLTDPVPVPTLAATGAAKSDKELISKNSATESSTNNLLPAKKNNKNEKCLAFQGGGEIGEETLQVVFLPDAASPYFYYEKT